MQGNKQLEAVASSFSTESVIGEQSVISDSALPALMVLAWTKHKEFEATWKYWSHNYHQEEYNYGISKVGNWSGNNFISLCLRKLIST